MKETLNKVVQVTNGKKTHSSALLFIAFALLRRKFPDLVDGNEILIENILIVLFSSGLGHKLWRNWKLIVEYIRKKFKGLKTTLK